MLRPRVPQPPVQRFNRDRERHDFWPGFSLALVASGLLFCGARHVTSLETQDGHPAWEFQLVRAFANSGLELVEPAPPDLDALAPPEQAAAALDRAARAEAKTLKARYRINTGAGTPCPT